VRPELRAAATDAHVADDGQPHGVVPERSQDRPNTQTPHHELAEGRRATEGQLPGVQPDSDRPNRGVADLDVAIQERVHIGGGQRQRVLPRAKSAFPKEKLG
jgi:hypothetical protein